MLVGALSPVNHRVEKERKRKKKTKERKERK